jgi:hypothetical protein
MLTLSSLALLACPWLGSVPLFLANQHSTKLFNTRIRNYLYNGDGNLTPDLAHAASACMYNFTTMKRTLGEISFLA